jgi:transposase
MLLSQEGTMRALQMPELTEEQQAELADVYRTTKDVRIRTRVQMVLLACEQHLSAPSIATIVRADEETVRRWLKRYLAEGIGGLVDRPRAGAPSKTTEAYEERLLEAVRRRPRSLGQSYSMWTLQRLADYLAECLGIIISSETVRRLLASHEIVFSQPQHTIIAVFVRIELQGARKGRPYSQWEAQCM